MKRSAPFEMYASVYASGRAVGEENIRNDTMVWRYKNEVYEIPASRLNPARLYNGFFYEMPIKELRALAKEK